MPEICHLWSVLEYVQNRGCSNSHERSVTARVHSCVLEYRPSTIDHRPKFMVDKQEYNILYHSGDRMIFSKGYCSVSYRPSIQYPIEISSISRKIHGMISWKDMVFEVGFVTKFSMGIFLKRGSAQPGCILGGLRFRSTAIRFFKFVWCFRLQVFHQFFLRNGSN
jgi:hypothetical protein